MNMTPDNFAYWLQGFFEITGGDVEYLTQEQIKMIKEHLGYVFAEKAKAATAASSYGSLSGYTGLLSSPTVLTC